MNNQSVSLYFEQDHERLDSLFRKFQELKRTDAPNAKEYFKEFNIGLQRHIVWEEDILFPLFEEKTGAHEVGPTAVMRMEHRQIKKHLEAIHDRVKVGNPDTDADEQLLLNTLFMHNQKEESILYPATDRLLSEAERKSVFTSMDAIPEERYHYCC